jgi:hypothetical protein
MWTYGGLVSQELDGRLRKDLRDRERVADPEPADAALSVYAGNSATNGVRAVDTPSRSNRGTSQVRRAGDEEDF